MDTMSISPVTAEQSDHSDQSVNQLGHESQNQTAHESQTHSVHESQTQSVHESQTQSMAAAVGTKSGPIIDVSESNAAAGAIAGSSADLAKDFRDANGDLSCDSIFGFNPESESEGATGFGAGGVSSEHGDSAPATLIDPALAQPVTYVTQSQFFTPLFNAAIFDGPIRIYFSQAQESQAMKLYFNLQQRCGDLRQQARDVFRERGANIFVMLYPDVPTFEKSFQFDFDDERGDLAVTGDSAGIGARSVPSAMPQVATGAKISQTVLVERLGPDYVIGVRGPVQDESFESISAQVEKVIRRK